MPVRDDSKRSFDKLFINDKSTKQTRFPWNTCAGFVLVHTLQKNVRSATFYCMLSIFLNIGKDYRLSHEGFNSRPGEIMHSNGLPTRHFKERRPMPGGHAPKDRPSVHSLSKKERTYLVHFSTLVFAWTTVYVCHRLSHLSQKFIAELEIIKAIIRT